MTTKFAAVTLKALAADPTLPQATKDALASLITLGNVTLAPAKPAKKKAARTFFSHKAIAADPKAGYPCTAPVPCSRRLSTKTRAAVHATTQAELQQFGHSADGQPLPK